MEDDAVGRAMEGQVVRLEILDTDKGRLHLCEAARAMDGAVDDWVSNLSRLKSEDDIVQQRSSVRQTPQRSSRPLHSKRRGAPREVSSHLGFREPPEVYLQSYFEPWL